MAEGSVVKNAEDIKKKRITVHGVVQGVGFRPFVYRLAHDYGLKGWVLNHSGGVDIEVEGPPSILDSFLADLTGKAPPLARIEQVSALDLPASGYERFEIRHSISKEGEYQLISPDIATCAECQREVADPSDRRYRYPFTNCTNCGPRFTIIESVPYDRPRTTMRDFKMCPACQREYDDPLDRRFHAQPNACPVCGPHLELVDAQGRPINSSPFVAATDLAPGPFPSREGEGCPAGSSPFVVATSVAHDNDVLTQAAALLWAGKVLALKGLGGFHLACDATNPQAVEVLRARKRRPDKPLAVMMASLDEVERHAEVNSAERELLLSPECPIVLLRWRPTSSVAANVAPHNLYLGVMLPYTPLHHILLRTVGRPLVMTSGNLSEEPIAQSNEEALRRLGRQADYFVLHNRDIYARYDDSVWFVPDLPPQPLRRSRGYAPYPIRLPFTLPPVLAAGAELKNTFCLTREDHAFLSQHIGDMENLETLEHFETTIGLYEKLFRTSPQVMAYDLHPDYLATQYARGRQEREGLAGLPVQHHHAHVASCLADNGWPLEGGPVIGVCFDGTGYGTDGHIWGGEFLVADYRRFSRAAHLQYLPMPGGEAAVRNPYRLSIGYLYALLGDVPPAAIPQDVSPEEVDVIRQQVDRRLNAPLTSSAGRLFDAVSALLGVRGRTTYEAQAAIDLEMLSTDATSISAAGPYPLVLTEGPGAGIIELKALFEALLADLGRGRPVAEMGWDFHWSVAAMIAQVCESIGRSTGLRTVALSGGCFQNRLLLQMTVSVLASTGWRVLTHHQVPCNDGGLSVGQAVVAGLSMMESNSGGN